MDFLAQVAAHKVQPYSTYNMNTNSAYNDLSVIMEKDTYQYMHAMQLNKWFRTIFFYGSVTKWYMNGMQSTIAMFCTWSASG